MGYRGRMRAPGEAGTEPLGQLAAAAGLVALAALLGRLASPVVSSADVVMGFLLAVLIAAFRLGRRAAILAAALSVGAYNFFFVAPYHTFAVAETHNLLTFAMLFGVGLSASALADRLRRQEADAVAREKRTAALLALTRATASAPDEAAVAHAVVTEAATRIARGAALWVPLAGGGARRSAEAGEGATGEDGAVAAALKGGPVVTPALAALPVEAAGGRLGVLVLRAPAPGNADLGDAWARQTALALARVRDAAAVEEATLRARTEELRSALLSTVSHDLRTPLAAITGAATTLLSEAVVPPEARRELLASVRDEAARLERLVANLLEMTRLASGPLALRRAWVPLDEIVGAGFARVEATLAGHPATADVPPDLPLAELDPVLFEHVLVNLLENAARHTPPGTPIRVAARADAGCVELAVSDEGPGFPEGDLARLFEPFVRGGTPRAPGSGLGLAIARGIVEAHGGTIRAERPPGGGASVIVRLPRRREPPSVPAEEEPR